MIRLDRSTVCVPDSWTATVAKSFPDIEAFRRKAEEFEALDIDCGDRRTGFVAFAEHVLPKTKGKHGFKPIWGQAKMAMAEMSHLKCAYCETPVTTPRSTDIEHFQPKSLFPSRVYDWNNYFLCCRGCNGSKWDQWPIKGGSYVRPDEGVDPAALFEFLENGEIRAIHESGPAAETIQAFGLNGKWLCQWRAFEIADTIGRLEDLIRADLPQEVLNRIARAILDRVSDPKYRYSAALRQCFVRSWKARGLPDFEP